MEKTEYTQERLDTLQKWLQDLTLQEIFWMKEQYEIMLSKGVTHWGKIEIGKQVH